MTALPRISVIIPCYRAAQTLPHAVASILADAPPGLQLLLVEDGSPDDTAAVCDALAGSDARITALHRENGGAAAARNTGLDAATGDWVMFVDADDELLSGFWSALPGAFSAENGSSLPLGMILYGMERDSSGVVPCPLSPGLHESLPKSRGLLSDLLFHTGYLAAPYPKLFRRDLLQKGKIRFDPALEVNEDVLFNIHFLQFSQKTSAIFCIAGVYYKQNDMLSESLSRRLRGDLLQTEEITHPALNLLLQAMALPPQDCEALLTESRQVACLNQYGLLTGRKGELSFSVRRTLFAQIIGFAPARAALLRQLAEDPNRLLALPYRFGVGCRLPGFLAAYTMLKSHFM